MRYFQVSLHPTLRYQIGRNDVKLYKAQYVADLLGCTVEHVWHKSRTLEWPHMKLGRHYRYSEKDIADIQEMLRPKPVESNKVKRMPL